MSTAGQCQAQYIVLDVLDFWSIINFLMFITVLLEGTFVPVLLLLYLEKMVLSCTASTIVKRIKSFCVDEAAKGLSVAAGLNQQFLFCNEDRNAVEDIFNTIFTTK